MDLNDFVKMYEGTTNGLVLQAIEILQHHKDHDALPENFWPLYKQILTSFPVGEDGILQASGIEKQLLDLLYQQLMENKLIVIFPSADEAQKKLLSMNNSPEWSSYVKRFVIPMISRVRKAEPGLFCGSILSTWEPASREIPSKGADEYSSLDRITFFDALIDEYPFLLIEAFVSEPNVVKFATDWFSFFKDKKTQRAVEKIADQVLEYADEKFLPESTLNYLTYEANRFGDPSEFVTLVMDHLLNICHQKVPDNSIVHIWKSVDGILKKGIAQDMFRYVFGCGFYEYQEYLVSAIKENQD